jgi:hypothetical protein
MHAILVRSMNHFCHTGSIRPISNDAITCDSNIFLSCSAIPGAPERQQQRWIELAARIPSLLFPSIVTLQKHLQTSCITQLAKQSILHLQYWTRFVRNTVTQALRPLYIVEVVCRVWIRAIPSSAPTKAKRKQLDK